MRYLYGPVKSRRLGLSLGISLTPHKVCSFDCVYCQLGRTTRMTGERKSYVDINDILAELREFKKDYQEPFDCISLSGFGEPVLNAGIRGLVGAIKELFPGMPLVVISNSSLFVSAPLRREVMDADVLIPSLDAVTQDVFEDIDRPLAGINIADIISGLAALRNEFQGRIYLEIMLVKGINDGLEYAYKFKEAVEKINPDRVQLNVPVRTSAEDWVRAPERERLLKIKDIIGPRCEII